MKGMNTRQVQRLPSPQVVGRCTCFGVSKCQETVRENEAPAGDLESRAKDLGTYKLGHNDLLHETSGE